MGTELRKVLDTGFDAAIAKTVDALKSEGFGVLTEIDVQNTLKEKLGAEMRRYRILGACNPPLAHGALQINLDAGLMMPCNVAVYEGAEGQVIVSAVDPAQSVGALGDAGLAQLAGQVREKLARVIGKLG